MILNLAVRLQDARREGHRAHDALQALWARCAEGDVVRKSDITRAIKRLGLARRAESAAENAAWKGGVKV